MNFRRNEDRVIVYIAIALVLICALQLAGLVAHIWNAMGW